MGTLGTAWAHRHVDSFQEGPARALRLAAAWRGSCHLLCLGFDSQQVKTYIAFSMPKRAPGLTAHLPLHYCTLRPLPAPHTTHTSHTTPYPTPHCPSTPLHAPSPATPLFPHPCWRKRFGACAYLPLCQHHIPGNFLTLTSHNISPPPIPTRRLSYSNYHYLFISQALVSAIRMPAFLPHSSTRLVDAPWHHLRTRQHSTHGGKTALPSRRLYRRGAYARALHTDLLLKKIPYLCASARRVRL